MIKLTLVGLSVAITLAACSVTDSDKAACSEAKEVLRDVDSGVYARMGADTGRIALTFDIRNINLDNEPNIEISVALSVWWNSVSLMERVVSNEEAMLRLAGACRDHGGIFSRDI